VEVIMSDQEFTRLPAPFGVEAHGVDVAGGVNAGNLRALAEALVEHKIVLLRGQTPTPEAYRTFAASWGPPRIDGFTASNLAGFDDIGRVGNTGGVLEQEAYRSGAGFWHTDCAAEPEPNATTMLYCILAPRSGGETVIADLQAAYEALDDETRQRIDPLMSRHVYSGTQPLLGGREDWEHELHPFNEESRALIPQGSHRPLVWRHPVSGRKGLYAPAGSMVSIDGMDDGEAHALVRRLKLHAIEDRFCYRHSYRPGDILMWDNTATMHCAGEVGPAVTEADRRLLYRICPLGLPLPLSH
jgi:taurine dioxygenase